MSAKSETKEAIRISRLACETSLEGLCTKILWRQQIQKDWAPIHKDLQRFLKTSGRRKLLLLPRNHLKSSVVTKSWSIQEMLKNHNIRVLISSDTWENARKFLRTIQKYLVQSLLPVFYGPFQSEHWNQDECTVKQRNQILDAPTFATTGIEKEQTSQHYDLIIHDDIVARENVSTPEQRQKVKTYYRDSLDLLEPTGTMVVIGTRWHQDDLYSDLLEDPNFDKMIRTCYTDDTRTAVWYPQKFTLEYLEKLRTSKGSYEFASQYLNNPIDQEAADFKSDWIKTYDPKTSLPTHLYCTVDPALSLSRDADYSALVVCGQYADRRIRVVDRLRARFVPSDLVDAIFKMVEKWNLHRIGVETFAFQRTLKYDLQRQQRERGVFFSIDELGRRHTGRGEAVLSKEARIRRLQPYFEQGLVEIRPDMQDLVDEILAFPRGKHDDLIDALSYQLDYLVPSMQASPLAAPDFKLDENGKYGYTMSWWAKKIPTPQMSIYDRFFADVAAKR